MGRRKIEIQPITSERGRQVTFQKRKNGLFKKAYELGVLCSVDVAVVIFGANNKLFEFCSSNVDEMILKRLNYEGEQDLKTSTDFANGSLTSGSKSGAGGADQLDSDDDDDLSDAAPAKSKSASNKSKPSRSNTNASVNRPSVVPISRNSNDHSSQDPMSATSHSDSLSLKRNHDAAELDRAPSSLSHHSDNLSGHLNQSRSQIELDRRQNVSSWRPDSHKEASRPELTLPALAQAYQRHLLSQNINPHSPDLYKNAQNVTQDFLLLLANAQNSVNAASALPALLSQSGRGNSNFGLSQPSFSSPSSGFPSRHQSLNLGNQQTSQQNKDDSSWLDFLSAPAPPSRRMNFESGGHDGVFGSGGSGGGGLNFDFPFGLGLNSQVGSGGGSGLSHPSLPNLGNLMAGFGGSEGMDMDNQRDYGGREGSEGGPRKRPRWE